MPDNERKIPVDPDSYQVAEELAVRLEAAGCEYALGSPRPMVAGQPSSTHSPPGTPPTHRTNDGKKCEQHKVPGSGTAFTFAKKIPLLPSVNAARNTICPILLKSSNTRSAICLKSPDPSSSELPVRTNKRNTFWLSVAQIPVSLSELTAGPAMCPKKRNLIVVVEKKCIRIDPIQSVGGIPWARNT